MWPLVSYNMLNSAELWARFYAPGAEIPAYGKLVFTPGEISFVELVSYFAEGDIGAFIKLMQGSPPTSLTGYTQNGTILWIPRCFDGGFMNSFPGFPIQKYAGIRACGACRQIIPDETTEWTYSLHAFRNLNNWFGSTIQPIPMRPSADWSQVELGMRIPSKSVVSVTMPDFTLEADFKIQQVNDQSNSTSAQIQTFIKVIPTDPRDYFWHIQFNSQLMLLFSLLTWSPANTKLLLTYAAETDENGMKLRPEGSWFISQPFVAFEENKHSHKMPIPLSDFETSISDIITSYFNQQAILKPSIELLINSIFELYRGGYSDFLAIAQSIETLYVSINGDVGSFKEKLTWAFNQLPAAVQSAIWNDIHDVFLENLKEHRHKIAHNDINFLAAIDQAEFIRLSLATKRFALALVFHYLGLTDQEIIRACDRAYDPNYQVVTI